MSILLEYLKLARFHSAVLTGLTPVLGAISVGMVDVQVLTILFFIGLFTHIFGFVLNEYMDVDIDRKAKFLQDKPLVKGSISRINALVFAFSSIIFGYISVIALIYYFPSSAVFSLTFYTLAWLSIGIYNLISKKIRGSDIALALWTGTLCLFGGFAVTTTPTYLLYIIAGLAFIQLLIQNILAGLKDISQDKLGFGTTTPIRMGVLYKKKKLVVPFKFQASIYCLKFVHLLLVFIPFLVLGLVAGHMQILIIFFILVFNFFLVFRIFNSIKFSRSNLLRTIGLHEILSYSLVPLMLFGMLGFEGVIFLIIFPIIWLALFMRIIYGRLLPSI